MIETLRQLFEGPFLWIVLGLTIGACIVVWYDQRVTSKPRCDCGTTTYDCDGYPIHYEDCAVVTER